MNNEQRAKDLERARKETADLLNKILQEKEQKIQQIHNLAKRQRGVNYVLTSQEQMAISNIEQQYSARKDELINRGKEILEKLEAMQSSLTLEEDMSNSNKKSEEEKLFDSDLKSVQDALGIKVTAYREDTAIINKGGLSYSQKDQNELTMEYQDGLKKIDELLSEGKIDRRKASELQKALYRIHAKYSSQAPKAKSAFEMNLESQTSSDKEFAEYAQREDAAEIKRQVEQELEQGIFGNEDDKNTGDKVEKGDYDYIW